MFRFFILIFSLMLTLSLIFNTVTSGNENTLNPCLTCHEETYVKATSNRYIHSVIKEGCIKCHYTESNLFDNTTKEMASLILLENVIFGIGKLPDEGKKYELKILASDITGEKSETVVINTGTEKVLDLPDESFNINEISDLKIDSITKGAFAKAVISWSTDVPATSEAEYGTSKKDRNNLGSRNTFSKRHEVVMPGLRHNSKYTFRVTSMDINGNALQSEEQSFDTSKEFGPVQAPSPAKEQGEEKKPKPAIANTMLFNIGEGEDIFFSISSNMPVEFKLTITEIDEGQDRPCYGFRQTRSSTIKVCTECHPAGITHTVGVRAKNPNLKIPEELPTIENGVITCVTCHFAHGGEITYFLRTELSKEICVKCHPEHLDSQPGPQEINGEIGGDERIRTAE